MMRDDGQALRVWFRLIRLNSRMESIVAERLRDIGLSVPQCDILTSLWEQEGISQQQLAERLYVTKGNISGLVDRLVAAGLVERRAPEGDRRAHAVFLTEPGRQAAEKAIAAQRLFVAETFGRLSESELDGFETTLLLLRDRLWSGQTAGHAYTSPTAPRESRKNGRSAT
jgi:DNA-binding MarR family transcriptional regulator